MCVCVHIYIRVRRLPPLLPPLLTVMLTHRLSLSVVNTLGEQETEREAANNYVSSFVSAPSIKAEERQPEHMSTYPLRAPQTIRPPSLFLSPTLSFHLPPFSCIRHPPTPPTSPPVQTHPSSASAARPSSVRFFRLQPGLTSQLHVDFCRERAHLPSAPLPASTILRPPLPHGAAGHRKRKNQTNNKTWQTVKILDCTVLEERRWFDVPCQVGKT